MKPKYQHFGCQFLKPHFSQGNMKGTFDILWVGLPVRDCESSSVRSEISLSVLCLDGYTISLLQGCLLQTSVKRWPKTKAFSGSLARHSGAGDLWKMTSLFTGLHSPNPTFIWYTVTTHLFHLENSQLFPSCQKANFNLLPLVREPPANSSQLVLDTVLPLSLAILTFSVSCSRLHSRDIFLLPFPKSLYIF